MTSWLISRYILDLVRLQWVSHTLIEFRSPPCEVCCVKLRLCRREMCPGMIWNSILATPACWAPTLTKNKIMKAGSRFVCFPKTLLHSRITFFLHPPKYLRESGTDWTAANQFWVEFLFHKFHTLSTHKFYPSLQSGCLLCVWLLQVTVLFCSSINHHFAMSSFRARASPQCRPVIVRSH